MLKKKHCVFDKMYYTIEYGVEDGDVGFFVATGEGRRILKSGRISRCVEVAGRIDEITEKVLGKDFVSFILRDVEGNPMYPLENGTYFLGYDSNTGSHNRWEDAKFNLDAVTDHFLITEEEALRLHTILEEMDDADRVSYVKGYIDAIKPMWKQKADALRKKYDV